jgi:hypothetical protein
VVASLISVDLLFFPSILDSMAALGGRSKVDMDQALAGVPWLVDRYAVILKPFEQKVHSTQRARSAAVMGSGPHRAQ